MQHFFLPPECFSSGEVIFPQPISRQIASVLRLAPGDTVVALDNQGGAFNVELQQVTGRRVTGTLRGRVELPPEPGLHLSLYVALTQREKFEWILQKATELGVSALVPVIFSRGLVQSVRDEAARRERWQAILREAAEQCGRLRIPQLGALVRWPQAVRLASQQAAHNVVLWEEETQQAFRQAFAGAAPIKRAALFIGPEGGITGEEIDLARSAGFATATLGRRVLRVETAAVAAVALAMFLAGEMA